MRKKQASASSCFVCGVGNHAGLKIKFYETGPEEVTAEYIVDDKFEGYPGVVHGGIIAAMLDEVAGRSLMMGEEPRFMVTAKINIRYRRPVPVGEPLKLVGRVKEDRGRIGTATGEIYDRTGKLLADAEVVMAAIPEELQEQAAVALEDWKVYPDEEMPT
jgi:uncharacterized protein (TIGR00369 family)